MRDLAAISATYTDLDGRLDSDIRAAQAGADLDRTTRLQERQRLNDQAYFVLCWGQLEAEINEICRRAIQRRQGSTVWEQRRGWDIYDLNDRRLSGLTFEERTAFVTDRTGGKGSPYAKIVSYYNLRNQIAHGQVLATRIDVPEVIRDFYAIQSQLKT